MKRSTLSLAVVAATCVVLAAGCTKRYIHYGELEASDSKGVTITTALVWVETVRTAGSETREGVDLVVKDRPQARVKFDPESLVFECRSTDVGVTQPVLLHGEAGKIGGCDSIDDLSDGTVRVTIHTRHKTRATAVGGAPQEYLAASAEAYEFEMIEVLDEDAPAWIKRLYEAIDIDGSGSGDGNADAE